MSHLLIVKRLELYMDLALYKINILLLLYYRESTHAILIVTYPYSTCNLPLQDTCLFCPLTY